MAGESDDERWARSARDASAAIWETDPVWVDMSICARRLVGGPRIRSAVMRGTMTDSRSALRLDVVDDADDGERHIAAEDRGPVH